VSLPSIRGATKSRTRNPEKAIPGATKQPDGQITSTSPDLDPSSPFSKNIPLNPSGKSELPTRPSHPTRGALRNVTNARWDAVDGMVRLTKRTYRGRRRRVVLAPRCWRQVLRRDPRSDGGKKAGHRGEHDISRKPLRREGRIASAEPVCSCAFSYVHFAHETAGAARTRLSLRPLHLRGPKVTQTSDASRREKADAYPVV
jgi:hypothetical protein